MSDALIEYTIHLPDGRTATIVADSVSTSEGDLVFYNEVGDPIASYRKGEHRGFTTPDEPEDEDMPGILDLTVARISVAHGERDIDQGANHA